MKRYHYSYRMKTTENTGDGKLTNLFKRKVKWKDSTKFVQDV